MQLQMYAIYDNAAGAYLTPFFTHNEQLAMRSFQDACLNPDTAYFRHPQDFHMFHMGQFDDASGVFELNHTPNRIVSALELRANQSTTEDLFNEISDDSQLPGHSESGHSQE